MRKYCGYFTHFCLCYFFEDRAAFIYYLCCIICIFPSLLACNKTNPNGWLCYSFVIPTFSFHWQPYCCHIAGYLSCLSVISPPPLKITTCSISLLYFILLGLSSDYESDLSNNQSIVLRSPSHASSK